MARRDLIQQAAWSGRKAPGWSIGATIAYQSTIWRIQGLVFGITAAGTPELRWVLDEPSAVKTRIAEGTVMRNVPRWLHLLFLGLFSVALLSSAALPVGAQPAQPTLPAPNPDAPSQPGPPSQAPEPPAGNPSPVTPGSPSPGSTPLQYVIAPGDILSISVLGEPEVSGPFLVAPDGTITMQLVGQVHAGGLTLPELTDKVIEALKKFIRTPQVAVSIQSTTTSQKFVYLIGRVNRPGAYVMQTGWTVAALMATAGGTAAGAGLNRVFIIRASETIPVDLHKLLIDGNTSANVALQAGDVMVVPESDLKVLLMGAVVRPGPYVIQPGDRLTDVLSAGGGPAQGAVLNDIGIISRGDDPKATPKVTHINLLDFYKTGNVKLNAQIQDGDIVYVSPKMGINWMNVLAAISSLSWVFLWVHP